ncbi:hypothetical protein JZ751_001124 [Albula glossodonta]|uniref:Alpha-type protein kinase domain-containing protein n=1 Tax=Albula glossodonta TaxID=121402 RepID=A0A8T2PSS9_9TELE|nr:hypothetical protein JZ751_001124 [Albula glossodonta]
MSDVQSQILTRQLSNSSQNIDDESDVFYDAVEWLSDISVCLSEDLANKGAINEHSLIRSTESLEGGEQHIKQNIESPEPVRSYGAPPDLVDIGYCFSINLWINLCQTQESEDEETIVDEEEGCNNFVDACSTQPWAFFPKGYTPYNEPSEEEDERATNHEEYTQQQVSSLTTKTEVKSLPGQSKMTPFTTCKCVNDQTSTMSDKVITFSHIVDKSTSAFTQVHYSITTLKDDRLEPQQKQGSLLSEKPLPAYPKNFKLINKEAIEKVQTGGIILKHVEEQMPSQKYKEATQSGVPLTEDHYSEIDGSLDKIRTGGCKKLCGLDTADVMPLSGHPPSTSQTTAMKGVNGVVREDIKCAPVLLKADFLSEQCFGEKQSACIMTEEVHFGEGMHRRAFRTKLLQGLLPLFTPGHPCVLKVHNAVSYGTKNNKELIYKNYNLAVEECYVQNIAREYIKSYTEAARTAAAFGEVPEIIPIYLVHRPSSDIPYATLEEELVGNFVKYSVKDGKEINVMRRNSEVGQKCCAFQHWVFQETEGNLLVTDMQGVGMKLTDVGIATCRRGYKGFRGNCAASFIDQFKALHQCNKFCVLLGLKSLRDIPEK